MRYIRNLLRALCKDTRGFSLIELLVVMVIIGMLAALVGPKLFKHVDKAKQRDASAQIAMFGEALDLYRLENHKYPQSLEEIGDYLKKEIPKDPWGNEYVYKSPGDEGREYDLICYGADGGSGGEGNNTDIVSWKGLD